MSNIHLREAFFHVDPIRSIVGFGDKMAFHIVIEKGEVLGMLGPVGVPKASAIANDTDFEWSAGAPVRHGRSWISRLLTYFKH